MVRPRRLPVVGSGKSGEPEREVGGAGAGGLFGGHEPGIAADRHRGGGDLHHALADGDRAALAGGRRHHALDDQVGGQDQDRQREDLIELGLMLQRGDLGGDDLCAGAGQEHDRGDRDHRVDEVVAEHLQDRRPRVRGDHAHDRLEPVVAHKLGRGLPRAVHLGQGVLDHLVRRGEVVHDVRDDEDPERVLQRAAGEREQKRDAEHHAGHGVDDRAHGVHRALGPVGQLGTGGHQARAVAGSRRAGSVGSAAWSSENSE